MVNCGIPAQRNQALRFIFQTLAAVLAFLLVAPQALAIEPAPEGKVRFYNIADRDFDRYSRRPGKSTVSFMRDHYLRMQVYSPYFDTRTSWYPNGWVYKNSYALKSHWPEFAAHPEWVLRGPDGEMLYIPWGCEDGTCPQYAADLGNPAFRAHWIDTAREIMAKGYRGIWVDDVNLTWRVSDGNGDHVTPMDPRTGEPMTLAAWQNNFAVFLEEIRQALPEAEIAHNAIWYADDPTLPAISRQIAAADYINLERGATDPGLKAGDGRWGLQRFFSFIDRVHADGKGVVLMDYGSTEQERTYGLAAYLLINSGADLMSSNQLHWTAPGFFWDGYGLDLGAARGTRYHWRGLLRRDFDRGFVLLNQPGRPTISVALPEGAMTLNGERRAVAIPGSSAVIVRCDPSEDARHNAELSCDQTPHPDAPDGGA